jgi:hypothetical protein
MVELQSITGARGGELFPLRGIDIECPMNKPHLFSEVASCTLCGHERPCSARTAQMASDHRTTGP